MFSVNLKHGFVRKSNTSSPLKAPSPFCKSHFDFCLRQILTLPIFISLIIFLTRLIIIPSISHDFVTDCRLNIHNFLLSFITFICV